MCIRDRVLLDRLAFRIFASDLRSEELKPALPKSLGLIHRAVRTPNKSFRIFAVAGIDAHTDACRDIYLMLVYATDTPDGLQQSSRCGRGVVWMF